LTERPPSVAESLDALVANERLSVSVVAHEPEVIDPVAIRFDEQGRLWVVEMHDYPTGPIEGQPPGGRIRILVDQDQDGRFELATTFADQLLFPTGIQPWKGGVIVTLAGNIVFLEDRDGDLRCDHVETWFEGFAEQNEQLRANHPLLGPDGRVYVAGGLRGGRIVSKSPLWQNEEPAIDLRGADFAFDPHGGFFGAVSGNSQFGLTIDDYGHRMGCSNRNPAMEAILSLEALGAIDGSDVLTRIETSAWREAIASCVR
ncbi:MAG: PVC-type heme-binding CxxCH protein, partial [Planctomycetota bacterium]